jgi:hypothetical protein
MVSTLFCLGAIAVAQACTNNLDCSLNGVCDNSECVCDAPWTGRSCGVLDRMPAKPGGAYGFSPNVTSWGASILPGEPHQAKWHMFVAEVPGGLGGWGQNSMCVHATSDDLTKPFDRVDVVLGAECHGPVAIRDPTDGAWLLFHQGSGPAGSNSSSFMHYAPSPAGPWAPTNATPPGDCGMPTAAFHPNGTLFLVCGNGDHVVSTPSRHGPFTDGVRLPRGPRWEDPTLWFDKRKNVHIIFHVFSVAPFAAGDWSTASGHAFSEDSLVWHNSDVEPFNGTVGFADGTSRTFATRERPQLLFSDAQRTTPSAITSAVSSQPVGTMCDSCVQGACSQCKVTPGRDWTFTIVQPLNV